ncbi:MAG: hypothetical protein HY782_21550 [Chloroflexi bacterium]|nr:hypothetical protein [Chloroflexota bacterium]
MKRLFILLALVMTAFLVVSPLQAADPITVVSNKFINNFRRNLQFQVEAQSSAKIDQIALLIQLDGVSSSVRQIPKFEPDLKVQAMYEWPLNTQYLPPGVNGQFWWTIQDSAGNQLQTPKQSFRVEDPAHKWQKLSNDKLVLYWYAGGDAFGKALFDKGVETMQFLEKDIGVSVDRQIQILIYGDRASFRSALSDGAQEWTGGQAFPDYGIVVINIEPNNLDWGKDAAAHELAHQVLHQKVKGPLGDFSLPKWMDEGLAVYYENPGKLDSQFSTPVRRAIQNDTLIPLRSLNSNFPADPAAANLSYGESWSVVDFIIRQYGKDKVAQMLQEFKAGAFYDDVLRKVLGVDIDGLETEWRKDIGAKPRVIPTRSNAPATAFPTFSLSTDDSPPPTTAPGAAATATPRPVAVNATPAAPATSAPDGRPPSAPSNPTVNLCGGAAGLIVLGGFGAAAWKRRRVR